MFSSAVVLPEVVAKPAGPPTQAVTLLQDLVEWSVVIVDEREVGLEALYRGIREWPPEYRHLGVQLLDHLGHRRRLVRRASRATPVARCGTRGCDTLREVADTARPERVFCGGGCGGGEPLADPRDVRSYVDIEAYPLFMAAERERLRSPREFVSGPVEMQRDFLEPALRFARTVLIYDRYVGRHLQDQPADGGPPVVMQRWSQTIRWIASTFQSVSDETPKELTIVTGLVDLGDLTPELEALARFRDSMSATCGLPVRLHVVQEARGRDSRRTLRHQRYLVTDHAAYQIDPGFDFLETPPRPPSGAIGARGIEGVIVPTTVARYSDAAAIATDYLTLPALRLPEIA